MLTWEENSWNFECISILTSLNLLPLQLNQGRSGEKVQIQIQPKAWKRILWHFSFLQGIFHWLYVVARLVEVIAIPELFHLGSFIVHFLVSTSFLVVHVWMYALFVKSPTNCVILHNRIFSPSRHQMQGQSPPSRRPTFKAIIKGEYSVHELLAMFWPLIMTGGFIVVLTILLGDPSRVHLIHALVPEEYRNWISFCILILPEAFFVAMAFGTGYYGNILQLEFLEKVDQEFEDIKQKLRIWQSTPRRNIEELREIAQEMRGVWLFIELFNRTFSFVIYSLKTVCLVIVIPFWFFFIRHISDPDHVLLALFAGYIAICCTFTYIIIYQKGWTIQSQMEELKNQVLVLATRRCLSTKRIIRWEWFEFKREIQSIKNAGVQVGNFHILERDSALTFVNVIVNNVVSLLVTFR